MIRKVVVFTILSIILSSCATSSSTNDESIGYVAADGSAVLRDPSERGNPIELNAKYLDGKSWNLKDFRGNVLILNTWGPWCAPCRTEVPQLQELLDSKSAEGLQVFGFATRTNESSVNAFLTKRNITYPQIADFDSSVISQIEGVPSATVPGTIFIDEKGRVAGFALGAADISLIRNLAESLLEE